MDRRLSAAPLLADPISVGLTVAKIPDRGPPPPPVPIPQTRQRCDELDEPLEDLRSVVAVIDAQQTLGLLAGRRIVARSQVKARLRAARQRLPAGFGLVVLDAWRSMSQQQALRGHYHADALSVASTDPAAMRPPHTTGGAVDLSLSYHGTPIAIGTGWDSFEPAAALNAFEVEPDSVVRRLRRLLSRVMTEVGFAPYEAEWWHWSYGDDVWASRLSVPALYDICTEIS